MRIFLELCVVGARGGAIEIPRHAGTIGRLDQVGIDENAAEAHDAEALDETHSPHVCRHIVNLCGSFDRPPAGVLARQVEAQALDSVGPLIPFWKRFPVDRPDSGETLVAEVAHEGPADESASPGHQDQVMLPASSE